MATSVDSRPASPRAAATGELVRWLIDDLDSMVDKQFHLAKQETRENVAAVLDGGKVLAVGAGLLLCALISLIALIIALLSLVLQLWAAALLTFLVFAVVGGGVTLLGIRRVRISPLAQTRETLHEDAVWAKQQLRPNER